MKKNLIQQMTLIVAAAVMLFPCHSIKAGQPTTLAAVTVQNHTLVLTVTDFFTRRPIKGARVTGYWDDGHHHTGPLPSAVTGDNGVAIIHYMAAPYWRISVTMPGYRSASTTRIATEPNRPDNLSLRMRR
ncbi:MAG TPA: carboxypeptidase-like regulatory domain-containing protein [Methylomirabilota bacterium]|nr:carboxypeptidase-like regulatory domain-containing protein [Methylomirabilota bacterium]